MKTVTTPFLGCVTAVLGLQGSTFSYEQGPIPPGIGPAVPYVAHGEYGDNLQWKPSDGRPWSFTFAYHANYDQEHGMIVRLYEQDGPRVSGQESPGSVLWSEFIDVRNGGAQVTIPLDDEFWAKAPTQLAFTVDFGRLLDGRVAGLYAGGGPVGDDYRDARYWQRDCSTGGQWGLTKFDGLTTAAAEFVATIRVTHVPEPSTWVLAGLGGLGLWAAGWRRKRVGAGSAHERMDGSAGGNG